MVVCHRLRGRVITDDDRLRELDRFDVLGTGPEPDFDRMSELAARICHAPLGFVNFIAGDHQFNKAVYGDWQAAPVMPLELSFCAHTIQHAGLMVVEDTTRDARFATHPGVLNPPRARFYAGVPIVANGHAIGTVCVLDRVVRTLAPDEEQGLTLIAAQLLDLLEKRKELLELRRAESLRAEAVEALLAAKTDLERRVDLRTRDVEEAHQRTRHILERVHDGFVALDRDWRYLYVNERAGELLGRPARSLIGKHIWTEFPDGVGQPFHQNYERAMREQKTVMFEEHYLPWDRWFENRIYPSPDGISIFFTEITERKRAQAEIEQSRARLLDAQRLAHVGSWEWNARANRLEWSDELHRIYGIGRDEFAGTFDAFLSRVHAEDRAHTQTVVNDAFANPKLFVYDHRIVRPNGEVRMLHTRGETLTDEKGQTIGMVGSCWDTTEQWRAAEELKRLRALLLLLVKK
jgi:PAS domain S-box-containing protein